jgi:hypothetical protein
MQGHIVKQRSLVSTLFYLGLAPPVKCLAKKPNTKGQRYESIPNSYIYISNTRELVQLAKNDQYC